MLWTSLKLQIALINNQKYEEIRDPHSCNLAQRVSGWCDKSGRDCSLRKSKLWTNDSE